MQEKYIEMLEYVKTMLPRDITAAKIDKYPFRNRIEHTIRVYNWVDHILKTEAGDRDVALTAAIFHDSGYTVFNGKGHEENGAVICEHFLSDKGYDRDFIDRVVYIVRNHSRKDLLCTQNITLEHAILMEADLIDETGAMAVVWDCMAEGNSPDQCYEKTLKRLKSRSAYRNPEKYQMFTNTSKKIWREKQAYFKNFVDLFEQDLNP